ncbi:MAG: FMN-binding glutamate synthase family protein [Dehalococcoidia bacterium]|nr:FMN-binding glutamate synthase family protein [Dehalococcoidia bacterium]
MEGRSMSESDSENIRPLIRESFFYAPEIIEDIQAKAELGRYRLRGYGTLRKLPSFDDLTFITSGLSRVPLEGYRESCSTKTTIGARNASEPLELETPIYITGMSYGALSKTAKVALGKAASSIGTMTVTGDGGMLLEEREASNLLMYQVLPSRYGFNPDHLKQADALEIVIGQGAKPGTGGLLMGLKVSKTIADQRELPVGIDQRSPVRHPDWMGSDDLMIKLEELREVTEGKVPIFLKLGAGRVTDDVKLAAKVGADAIVIDGMEAGTGASPELQLDHTGVPTMPATAEAVKALHELGLEDEVDLIISGGITSGADIAKALALGAKGVAIGTAALIALNCNKSIYVSDYERLGTRPGACHHCHTGMCPVGITTQDPELESRLDLDEAAERVANYLNALTLEVQLISRACGKRDIHNLEPEDLRALTIEASAMTGVPLVGNNKIY